jgi:L-rhamnose-H+ transport protein
MWFLQFFFMEWEKVKWEWSKLMDFAHGIYHFNCQFMGCHHQRMERRFKKTISTIIMGMLVMFISILIVGYGNSLR